jgi:D-alanyl-D-alanine dipeptidase
MPSYLRPATPLVAGVIYCFMTIAASATELPHGFVYLSDIDPTIAQDMRYAGENNFTGARVAGYLAAECILTERTAKALAAVQRDLAPKGYGIEVLDCYRPLKAVKRFVEWASENGPADPGHNPNVPRNRLVAEGYIGKASAHSSGGTVDLTLVRLAKGSVMPLDLGTPFDFFDARAHIDSIAIPQEARKLRMALAKAMAQRGFKGYRREWWHFSYRLAPFPTRRFDFDIPPKPS